MKPVTGRHRFRYFRRPLVGGLSVNPVISTEVDDAGLPWMAPRVMPTSTVLATENSNTRANAMHASHKSAQERKREVSVQSTLRESDMQTVRLVERMRERKVVEESLPEGSDMASLKLRAQMVEEMELKELQRRDAEITTYLYV
ncbi:hypothetical protein FOZ60_003038 [Perkinsus olseni]|uniref:Cilia- and flagella-associated protein 91 n=1 Tax=Perkinsus olseni TaxID=32597 RepID=A0A7J6PK74_PEROL|nr:hypothetical protein FOZ60_003038 [Perkinsus olseni]